MGGVVSAGCLLHAIRATEKPSSKYGLSGIFTAPNEKKISYGHWD
jgi:hypothetical protein